MFNQGFGSMFDRFVEISFHVCRKVACGSLVMDPVLLIWTRHQSSATDWCSISGKNQHNAHTSSSY